MADPVTLGEVIATLGGMTTTTKGVMDIVRAARDKSKNKEVNQELTGALDQIFSLQSTIIDLKTKVFELEQKNTELRNQIREEEKRAEEREEYERKEIRGSTVMVRKGDPSTYYCQACFESKKKPIALQRMSGVFRTFGSHKCPGCSHHYELA